MHRCWPLLLAIGLSCASVEVTTVAAPGVALSSHETWAEAPAPWDHPVVGEALSGEIDRAMREKGYRKTDIASADLLITYRAHGERQSRRRNAGDPDVDFYVIRHFIAGSVFIDVFDRRSQQLVWEGIGRIDVTRESDAAARKAAVDAARAILARFPPRS